MVQIDTNLLLELLSVLSALALAALATNWGVKYQQLKDVIRKLTALLDELDAALQDDKVSEDEWMELYQRAIALKEAIKGLIGPS